MPRAVGSRVHRTSLPTATNKPSSPRCIYTSHLTWTGKRAASPRHGSCLRGQAAKHAVPLVVVVDGGSKQQGKQQCMLLCGGGRANEVGFQARAQQSYSEPNPLRQIDVLTKGTLQKWWLRGCVPLAYQRARRQEAQRGREEAGRGCLMVMHARAEGKGKTHTHHETRHRRRDHLKRAT